MGQRVKVDGEETLPSSAFHQPDSLVPGERCSDTWGCGLLCTYFHPGSFLLSSVGPVLPMDPIPLPRTFAHGCMQLLGKRRGRLGCWSQVTQVLQAWEPWLDVVSELQGRQERSQPWVPAGLLPPCGTRARLSLSCPVLGS